MSNEFFNFSRLTLHVLLFTRTRSSLIIHHSSLITLHAEVLDTRLVRMNYESNRFGSVLLFPTAFYACLTYFWSKTKTACAVSYA